MDHKELIERLRFGNTDSETMNGAADAIESLLAENGRLKAELAKYRDAPVVAVKLTWGGLELKDVYSTLPKGTQLIVKPGEEK